MIVIVKYKNDYCFRMYDFNNLDDAFNWLDKQSDIEYYKIIK